MNLPAHNPLKKFLGMLESDEKETWIGRSIQRSTSVLINVNAGTVCANFKPDQGDLAVGLSRVLGSLSVMLTEAFGCPMEFQVRVTEKDY